MAISRILRVEIKRLKSALSRISRQKRLLFPELPLNELDRRAGRLADLVVCERHLRALLDKLQRRC